MLKYDRKSHFLRKFFFSNQIPSIPGVFFTIPGDLEITPDFWRLPEIPGDLAGLLLLFSINSFHFINCLHTVIMLLLLAQAPESTVFATFIQYNLVRHNQTVHNLYKVNHSQLVWGEINLAAHEQMLVILIVMTLFKDSLWLVSPASTHHHHQVTGGFTRDIVVLQIGEMTGNESHKAD